MRENLKPVWRVLAIGTAAILLSPAIGAAAPIGVGGFLPTAPLINFDNLTGGTNVLAGDVITTQYASQGIVFFNPDYPVRANASPIASIAATNSDPNVAFVQQHDGTNGRPLQLQFGTPVSAVGTKFFTSLNSTITLTAYSSTGQSIESLTLTGPTTTGDVLEGFIGLQELTPIAYAELSSAPVGGGSPFNFSIDDVRFQPTPEPAALSVLGVATVALCRRRR